MKNKLFNYLTLIIVIVSCPCLVFLYFRAGFAVNGYTFAGLSLMIPALVLFIIARIQLGSSFQVSAKANKLVTEGIYKKIRHPVYLFGLMFLLGCIVFIQMFYLLIPWVFLIFLQIRRISREEKVLEDEFGDQYAEYKKGTWF